MKTRHDNYLPQRSNTMESQSTRQRQWYDCTCGHTQSVSIKEIEDQYQNQAELSMRLTEIYAPMGFMLLEDYSAKMTVEIECEKCADQISVIIEVKGTPLWNYTDKDGEPRIELFSDIRILQVLHSEAEVGYSLVGDFKEESSEEPEFDYFPDIEDVQNSQEESIVNLEIIVQTAMKAGFCHLGFDFRRGKILRPLYRPQEGCCCWDEPLKIDNIYAFQTLRIPGDSLGMFTPLPHCNEDLIVDPEPIKMELNSPRPNTFLELQKIAKPSVEEIFGSEIKECKYVEEGVNCPSVGILSCNGRELKLFRDSFDYRKRRIRIGKYAFTITAINARDMAEDLPDLPTLVILGLARPFAGTKPRHFDPRRCYILALRILQNTHALTH